MRLGFVYVPGTREGKKRLWLIETEHYCFWCGRVLPSGSMVSRMRRGYLCQVCAPWHSLPHYDELKREWVR